MFKNSEMEKFQDLILRESVLKGVEMKAIKDVEVKKQKGKMSEGSSTCTPKSLKVVVGQWNWCKEANLVLGAGPQWMFRISLEDGKQLR